MDCSCGLFMSITYAVIAICVTIVLYFKHSYGYWARRKIPYLEPKIPMGNCLTVLPKGISFGIISRNFYQQIKQKGFKLAGVYAVTQPNLVIADPEYIKDILTRDFQYFVDRGIYKNKKIEPIMCNIFSLDGDEWRDRRTKLSSTFSSGRIKTMLQSVLQCSNSFKEHISTLANQNLDIEILEEASRFTTDVIGSTIFGIECNSLNNPESEFRAVGKRVFGEFTLSMSVQLFLVIYFPDIAAKMGIRSLQKKADDFFRKSLKEVVEYREKNNIQRGDFLQLLINMKNTTDEKKRITMEEVYAEASLFFLAGFETSSKTISFALYHLSRNMEAQERLRQEINQVLKKCDDEITYENLTGMTYLQQVLEETLRMWPILTTLTRRSTKSYKFKDSDYKIEKGTRVMIPVLGLHHDPEYFPDPEKWDPERFNSENKPNIDNRVYLPFGYGPRNCIGLRFGQMQAKIGIARIVKNFEITLSPKTKLPLGYDPDTFLLKTNNTIYLRMKRI